MNKKRYAAILLVAGLSSRMGKLKALLRWDGKPLIQYQIEQLQAANIDDIIVVLGHRAEELKKVITKYNVKTIINEDFKLGKSSSIRVGATLVEPNTEGIFISAVDQPVPSHTLLKIKKHLQKTEAAAVIPVYEKKRGHPILIHGRLVHDLLNVNEETEGLRHVIQSHKKEISYLAVNDPTVLLNFNHPEDYVKKEAF